MPDLGDVSESFLFLEVTLTPIPESSPGDTHWFSKLDFGGVLAFLCCQLPVWGARTCVHGSPRRMSHNEEKEWKEEEMGENGGIGRREEGKEKKRGRDEQEREGREPESHLSTPELITNTKPDLQNPLSN